MTYKLKSDGFARIACAKCHLLMADYGHGHRYCATCLYGPSFSKSSEGARVALAAREKRRKLAIVRARVV